MWVTSTHSAQESGRHVGDTVSKQFPIQLDVILFQGHAQCWYLIETRNRVKTW